MHEVGPEAGAGSDHRLEECRAPERDAEGGCERVRPPGGPSPALQAELAEAGGVAQFECIPAYDPEEVAAYEVGYKGAYFGGRATLSAALFYYDYTDFQVTQVIGLGTATINAGDAEVKGAEIEAFAMLGDAWAVSAAVTLLDATYGDFKNLDGLNPTAGLQQLNGNRLNVAPETSINFGVSYTARALPGGSVTIRADAAYRSRTFLREFNAPEDSQAAYTVVNVDASWESADGSWETRLFAKNLGNEVYLSGNFGVGTVGGRFATYGMPRQVGLELTRRFGAY